jgi:hypothetical protein
MGILLLLLYEVFALATRQQHNCGVNITRALINAMQWLINKV